MLRRAFLQLVGISPIALIPSDTNANIKAPNDDIIVPGDIVFFKDWKEKAKQLKEMIPESIGSHLMHETKGIGIVIESYLNPWPIESSLSKIKYVVRFEWKTDKYLHNPTHTARSLIREQLIKIGENDDA